MEAKEVKVEELYGKWYEQCVDGAVLTIEENTMTYERKDKTVRSPYQFRKDKEGHDLWYFVAKDIPSTFEQIIYHPSFNPELDGLSTRMAMVVYDMIYHPKNFRRQPYKAPEYGEIHLNTDKKAIKWFQDYRIRKLKFKVQEPNRESGMMAPTPPYFGFYSYEIERTEEGGGIIRAVLYRGAGGEPRTGSANRTSFGGMMMANAKEGLQCPEVAMTPQEMNQFELFVCNSKIDQLNGINEWQDEVPSGTESFDLSIQFYKESYHARANHIFFLPDAKKEIRGLHMYIFKLLVQAGLDYVRNEFHSTKPMLRIPSGNVDDYLIKMDTRDDVKRKGEAGMMFRFICDLDDREPWISEYTINYDESQDILNPYYAEMSAVKRTVSPMGFVRGVQQN